MQKNNNDTLKILLKASSSLYVQKLIYIYGQKAERVSNNPEMIFCINLLKNLDKEENSKFLQNKLTLLTKEANKLDIRQKILNQINLKNSVQLSNDTFFQILDE